MASSRALCRTRWAWPTVRGGEGAALMTAVAKQLGVPVGDVRRLQLLQRVAADMRRDLPLDQLPVAFRRLWRER